LKRSELLKETPKSDLLKPNENLKDVKTLRNNCNPI